jgi:hypothetical protein
MVRQRKQVSVLAIRCQQPEDAAASEGAPWLALA